MSLQTYWRSRDGYPWAPLLFLFLWNSPLVSVAASGSAEWPQVTFVGAVAPDVLEVVVQTGTVIPPRQEPYVPQPGDQVNRQKTGSMVTRHGAVIGGLVGRDEKLIFGFAKVAKVPFAPEDWRQVTRILVRDEEAARSAPPSSVELKTRPWEVARVGPWSFDAPLEHHFYFRLANPLEADHTYHIQVEGTECPVIPPFRFDPRRSRSEAVHVSQLGFRPDDPVKVAFLSCWMGTGGGYSYAADLPFEVLEEPGGRLAFQGRMRLSSKAEALDPGAGHSHTRADVFEADFSGLSTPGTYRLSVAGVGVSLPFPIGTEAWRQAFLVGARGFYHHRRSIALGPPYTSYHRPAGLDPRLGEKIIISNAGLWDTGDGLNSNSDNFTHLVAGRTSQLAGPEAWGGLMDAGDWDSRAQHLVVTRYLLELAEIAPAFFGTISLKIPESQNELPDVVDEALFNLDHYRRLQLPDGGVRGGVEQEEHPKYGEASWQNSLETLTYSPDPWSSCLYAAASARAALVLDLLKTGEAALYRESAIRAMRWAEAHRQPEKYPEPVRDARALAAAELFRLTGDPAWQKIFAETHRCDQPGIGDEDARDAVWAYVNAHQVSVDRTLLDRCRRAFLKTAAERAAAVEKTAFYGTWETRGWGFLSPDNVLLARAHQLTGEVKFLRALLLASQLRAGANPLNLCYTTGLGHRWPRRPLHVDSEYSSQAPPPGITVMGNVDVVGNWEKIFDQTAVPYFTPDRRSWPALESYWEQFWYPPMAEYTVQFPMAAMAYTWGYLAAR